MLQSLLIWWTTKLQIRFKADSKFVSACIRGFKYQRICTFHLHHHAARESCNLKAKSDSVVRAYTFYKSRKVKAHAKTSLAYFLQVCKEIVTNLTCWILVAWAAAHSFWSRSIC